MCLTSARQTAPRWRPSVIRQRCGAVIPCNPTQQGWAWPLETGRSTGRVLAAAAVRLECVVMRFNSTVSAFAAAGCTRYLERNAQEERKLIEGSIGLPLEW
jgi:hypothetical protein